jgi:hypothetical protein
MISRFVKSNVTGSVKTRVQPYTVEKGEILEMQFKDDKDLNKVLSTRVISLSSKLAYTAYLRSFIPIIPPAVPIAKSAGMKEDNNVHVCTGILEGSDSVSKNLSGGDSDLKGERSSVDNKPEAEKKVVSRGRTFSSNKQ